MSTLTPHPRCLAISHSSRTATDHWVISIGGEWEVSVLVDESRALYRQWGLGEAHSAWYNVNPRALYSAYRLGKDEGIWGTGVEQGDQTGSWYQVGGAFAVDAGGVVRWYVCVFVASHSFLLHSVVASFPILLVLPFSWSPFSDFLVRLFQPSSSSLPLIPFCASVSTPYPLFFSVLIGVPAVINLVHHLFS